MSCRLPKCSYLVRRLGEDSLFPEVRSQVAVGFGDGIEGGFSCREMSHAARHTLLQNQPADYIPQNTPQLRKCGILQGPGRPWQGLSDEPTKLRFLSLSIYDNYTTGRKCNRADWEIWECDSSKPHVPGITFNRTCTASRSRGFCLTAGGTNLNKTELLCPISDKSGQKLRASPRTHRSCRGWPCSPALTCSSRQFQPSSAASWGQGRTRSRCHGEPGSGAPARSHSAR